jgi:methylase of polypeptide subunit release factors
VLRAEFSRIAEARGLRAPDVLATQVDVPEALLTAVRSVVAGSVFGGAPRGSDLEQLGSAYERLLDFTCDEELRVVPSQGRRHAGAHYTPRALADEVVGHALEPLADADVLGLRIADIAVGSGVFLVAAAEILATRLVRQGWDADEALRAVIAQCLYGADVNETAVELCRLSLWLLAGDPLLPVSFLDDRILAGDALLDVDSLEGRRGIRWAERLPEVMAAGGFDAVVGNPPFLGVKSIKGAVGGVVRDRYAATLLGGESGRSDLVVFFLAQAARLSRDVVALVLPDAVAEGDSARFGLGALVAGGARIYRAETSRPWPSDAGVRIALVWLRVVAGEGPAVLDGAEVEQIGPSLGRSASTAVLARRTPPSWMPHGYQATIVLGTSLLLSPAEAEAMAAEDARSAAWIRPYLSGDDLVSVYGSPASRFALDLGGTDLETLRSVPPIARRLAQVRAERDQQVAKYPQLAERWWGFLAPVERLYAELDGRTETIALAKHAKYVWPVLAPVGSASNATVFSNGTIVYPTEDRAVYALLAAEPHRLWAVQEGGSRLNQSHRYNPSRLLRSYPFPDEIDGLREPGEALAEAVRVATGSLAIGVTELLNLVHAGSGPAEVETVRRAIAAVDRAAVAAHGIDLELVHGQRVAGERTWFGLDAATTLALKEQLVLRAV